MRKKSSVSPHFNLFQEMLRNTRKLCLAMGKNPNERNINFPIVWEVVLENRKQKQISTPEDK